MSYFDSKEAMKWEKKYGFETTSDYVEKYIKYRIVMIISFYLT